MYLLYSVLWTQGWRAWERTDQHHCTGFLTWTPGIALGCQAWAASTSSCWANAAAWQDTLWSHAKCAAVLNNNMLWRYCTGVVRARELAGTRTGTHAGVRAQSSELGSSTLVPRCQVCINVSTCWATSLGLAMFLNIYVSTCMYGHEHIQKRDFPWNWSNRQLLLGTKYIGSSERATSALNCWALCH